MLSRPGQHYNERYMLVLPDYDLFCNNAFGPVQV